MNPTTTNRVALITGGTGALGKAVVRRFLDDGAEVHVSWLVEKEKEDLRAALGPDAVRVRLHRADVSDAAAVERLTSDVAGAGGKIHVLANLVGGFAHAPLDQTDPAVWQKMLTMNATTAFLCCRYAVPHMRAAGWGRIVNVAAQPALGRGAANLSAYAAGKSAVLNLTYSLSQELVRDRITVNAIVPSTIDTPANRASMPQAERAAWLAPADIAGVIAFLCGESAAIVTGTAVNLSLG
ncbi:MAG TPA: SDR family NAD(P)-dependent oxidoreductase [Gemmatimonadales bacterium]|nr:SDR family NAD(P)-dependent oxidoreductase [Gemmatimonadales bacterium]